MRYYIMNKVTDPKVIGRKYPQITPVSGARYDNPLSIIKLNDDYPMTQTNSVYSIEKTAKLTDALSMGFAKYFAVNERTKELFSEFNIRDTAFIPIEIMEPSNSNWYVIYFPYTEKSVDLINYDETVFYITDGLGEENHGEFIIGNKALDKRQEWRNKYKTIGDDQEIWIKKLVLKKEFENIDLFYLSPFYGKVIVSENIKNEFEAKGITGLSFNEKSLIFG